jgi:prepilin-type N-terminal cleavage/methylation domain-containing protein
MFGHQVIARLRGERADEGLSLVEMIVTVAVGSIVAMFTFQLLILGVRSTGGSAIRVDNGKQSGIAVDAMSKNLRTAVDPRQIGTCTAGCSAGVLAAADRTKVTIYANTLGPGQPPLLVTYQLATVGSRTDLTETVQPAVVSAAAPNLKYSYCTTACTARTRTLARGVVGTGTTPLFTYYDAADAQLTAPVSTVSMPALDSVDIALKVQTSSSWSTPPTTVHLRVSLPNADVARTIVRGS